MIQSLWLPVIKVFVEVLAHAGNIAEATAQHSADKTLDSVIGTILHKKQLSPKPLIDLRYHFNALKEATDLLAAEWEAGTSSAAYNLARSNWVDLFAPAVTALHSIDPRRLSTLGIYAPRLAALLSRELVVTLDTLSQSLEAENAENYDNPYDSENAHLCTLCLYNVRIWSDQPTTPAALKTLSSALSDTMASLDCFIKTNWTAKEL